ncbi:ABC1 kinase family protein [Glaciecola siphonariae]|uniref:ABC1 kinase family protein n=1 Tax=Glaciecola siphonariae TaxID=521012 RepID=A0ABV9LQE8_9ALTE
MNQNKASKIPASRLSRLGKLGKMAGSIATSALGNTASQLLKAQRPSVQSTLLTSTNASTLTKHLSEMRGAAMKVGQMLSMDAGEFLPPEWEPILATLRQGADSMPKTQLLSMLNAHWGNNWANHFSYFSFEPVAAASIGQVHKAQLKTGEWLAVKVQYPGVAQSIDSDVNNIGRFIKLSGMLPKGFDLDTILQQAKAQLISEADYAQEAEHMKNFAKLLQNQPQFLVPEVYAPLSNQHILCMSFIEGVPIESLCEKNVRDQDKQAAINALFRLMLAELFDYALIQSDPNFANYLYAPKSKQIVLLDFGACRPIPDNIQRHYKQMALGMLAQDVNAMQSAMRGLSLINDSMTNEVESVILNACLMASECLQTNHYNFKSRELIQRLYDSTKVLMKERSVIEPPNFDVALVNRKVSGMVMLANKFCCDVSLKEAVEKYAD